MLQFGDSSSTIQCDQNIIFCRQRFNYDIAQKVLPDEQFNHLKFRLIITTFLEDKHLAQQVSVKSTVNRSLLSIGKNYL